MSIRVGTRGSRLARAQTAIVCDRLAAAGHATVQVVIETRGDRDQRSTFPEFGGPGVFVREIEEALLDGRIDLAVHSYKDLPSTGPAEAVIVAIPEREDPADVLLARADAVDARGSGIPLRPGARVGTASARREALLGEVRKDLEILPIRGNIDTRIRRLLEGSYDAIVLASAGIARLVATGQAPQGLDGLHRQRLEPAWFVPAPAQGALAIQARRDDAEAAAAARSIHGPEVAKPVAGERRLLELVAGDCELPFGAWCRRTEPDSFEMSCVLGGNGALRREHIAGSDPLALAEALSRRLVGAGAVSP